jgi:hypothetical protein
MAVWQLGTRDRIDASGVSKGGTTHGQSVLFPIRRFVGFLWDCGSALAKAPPDDGALQ